MNNFGAKNDSLKNHQRLNIFWRQNTKYKYRANILYIIPKNIFQLKKKLSSEKISHIESLLLQNLSLSQISKKTGVSRSSISGIKKKKGIKSVSNRPGRRKILSNRDKRRLVSLVNNQDVGTATQATRILNSSSTNKTVSPQTVRRALKEEGYHSFLKKKKPKLTARHKRLRLEFAKNYQSWTIEDWKKVVFSDETRVNMLYSDGPEYCWKKKNSPIDSRHVKETLKFGGGGIMVWACFCFQGVGYETMIQGTMDSDKYIQILEDEYLETLEFYEMDSSTTWFQHDNDPKHTSIKTKNWLNLNLIPVLKWPPQSPDLNPIEMLWFQVKSKLKQYPTLPTSSQELWERFIKEWRDIPTERCQALIRSMPKRIEAVIKAKGGHTKY